MARSRINGAVVGPLGSLYQLGAAGGLTDGQLLECFLSREDPVSSEAAFAELVDRHGSMVLDVCRRELRDPDEAHDAFQATFLVLVSKAATIQRRDSVGGWLYVIARRVAAQARGDRIRRRRLLQQFGWDRSLSEDGPPTSAPGEPEPDLAPLIDEVGRLPERYRTPVVLHYFEGLSTEATAQRLGCARGTVLSRLSRARHRLRQRLERRGVSPAVLLPATDSLRRWLPSSTLPAHLATATTRSACSLRLAGAAIESVVPTKVASLSRRVVRALALPRLGAASLLLVAIAGVSIALAATLEPTEDPPQGPAMSRAPGAVEKGPAPGKNRRSQAQPVVIRGQVRDPDGRPVAGARLIQKTVKVGPAGEYGMRSVGLAGPDGRFEVSIQPVPDEGTWYTPIVPSPLLSVVAATAPGFGPDWAAIFSDKAGEPLTLTLRRDDVPIEGRVVNLEGRPIAGLRVRLEALEKFPPAFLDEIRSNGGQIDLGKWAEVAYGLYAGEGEGELIPSVRTDADGRFRMTGLGRDRGALLLVDGGSIERTFALAMTSGDRDFRPIPLDAPFSGARTVEGPRFTITAAPGRVFDGVVRDRDTGLTIAGARINDWWGRRVVTDAHGRFRIENLPRTGPTQLSASVDGQPYVECFTPVNGGDGLRPIHIEMMMKRGVWVEGRVIDRASGRPVQAILSYYPTTDNPHVKDYPGALFLENSVPHLPVIPTDADGRFRAAVPPGRGLLTVRSITPGYIAVLPSSHPETRRIINPLGFGPDLSTYNAFVSIDLPESGGKPLPDIALSRGREQHLRLVDPEGKLVTGTTVYCLQTGSTSGESLATADLPFIHATPGKPVTIAAVHEGRALGAKVDLQGNEADPLAIAMQPTGTVTGRLVHEDGKPRPGVRLEVRQRMKHRGYDIHTDHGSPITTGPDGRFRVPNLIPGMTYGITVASGSPGKAMYEQEGFLHSPEWTIKPGETREWGDVQVQSYRR